MAKSPPDRPDLTWPNGKVADAIAHDGSHFIKHGKEMGFQTPAEYSQHIKDALDNRNSWGATMRVAPHYLNYSPEKMTPEFSSQTFYDPDRKLLVTTHLKRDLSGKMTVNGTAHSGSEKDYFDRLQRNAALGNNPFSQIKKESGHFERLAKMQQGGRDVIVAAKLSQLVPNMMRTIFSHFGLVGAGVAAGLTKFFGGSNAQAMQAAADATPGLRIATSPNSHEKFARTAGAYTAGISEETFRYVNDVAKSFGGGDPQIADGVVREGARLVGATIRAGYDAAFGPKEMPPPLSSEIEKLINPGYVEPPLFKATGRNRQTLGAPINASLPLSSDPPPKAQTTAVVKAGRQSGVTTVKAAAPKAMAAAPAMGP